MSMLRALLLAGVLAAGTQAPAGAGVGATAAPVGFGWLHPRPAPGSWSRSRLPAEAVVLAVPSAFRSVPADRGALSRAVGVGPAYRFYVNVTPNPEPVDGFAAARIDHQRDETLDVHELGSARAVTFDGGRGACVADSYVTSVGAHHYDEYACLVEGRHGSVEVVTAAAAAHWGEEVGTFRRILEGLRLR
jgi:hypothetical protein